MNWTPVTDHTCTITSECCILQLYLPTVGFWMQHTYIWKNWGKIPMTSPSVQRAALSTHNVFFTEHLPLPPSCDVPGFFPYQPMAFLHHHLYHSWLPSVHSGPCASICWCPRHDSTLYDSTLLLRPRHPVRPTPTLTWVRFIQLLYSNPVTWFLCISYLVPKQHG